MPLLSLCRDCFKWAYPDLLRLMSNNMTQWAVLEPTMFSDLHKKLAVVLSVTTAAGVALGGGEEGDLHNKMVVVLSVTTAAGVDSMGGRYVCVLDGRGICRNMNGCRVDLPLAP